MSRVKRRALLAGMLALPGLARAFPERPVRLIIPYGAGNVTDICGRALADALTAAWPQRVVVENLPGAGGTLGVAAAARAAPDGHTLVLSAMAAVTVSPHLQSLPYDPLTDLAPLSLVAVTRGALAVHPALAVGSLAELAAEAGRRQLFYYSAGPGTLPHLNMELLNQALGTRMEHVPYRTSAAGLADLLAGRVQLTMDAASVTLPAILDARLRALFWNGPQRNPRLPNLPTAAEALPSVELANPWLGLFVPRATPEPVRLALVQAVAAVMARPDFAARLGEALEPLGGGPEPLARQLRADHARFGALIARLGIKGE